ncbi:Arc family DNA-binding protein [Heyndrickxia sp. FSL W8-0496]|uniref:Arc family DNA-binding protein n=1 Tax=Heyndrickxia sp. FSL W8-0496 TaxID=2954702 RepID=UPI0030F74CA4
MSEQKRFTLRMDGELFETIKERAEKNKRSVAKEIELLLETYLEQENKETESSK